MYDEKLFLKALSILKLCPLFMFGLGYWAMSNQQILENKKMGGGAFNMLAMDTKHYLFSPLY